METADEYERVVWQGDGYRLIRCKHNLQFIAQRRAGGSAQRPWRGFSYFATPAGAARLCAPPHRAPEAMRQAALALFAEEKEFA